MSEYKTRIAIGAIVAVLGAAGLAALFSYSPVITPSGTAATTAAPCSAPGVLCGTFEITRASLKAPTGAGSNYSILDLTLSNTGNMRASYFEVFLNNKSVGQIQGPLQAGDRTTASMHIPSSIVQVTKGSTYFLRVEAFSNQSVNGVVSDSVTAE